ncbi:MAG: DUF4105 domain-containing protein [Paludibacteraceae bacterium]|nr:DUF4105 domain-containing protein [Paludibacteraceae bacterium]
MWYKKLITSILLVLGAATGMAQQLSEKSKISLITCSPGDELYARYGHTALLVYDPVQNIQWVFNYGLFDFEVEDFYLKFVKGETFYELGVEDYQQFLIAYSLENRQVYEQELNLSLEQRQAFLDALLENYLPQNRKYLYNFVFDNCATRPLTLIRNVLGQEFKSTYRGYQGLTYREFISHYSRPSSWADFGINLLFGKRADQPMTEGANLFLPEEVMNYVAGATLSDSKELVRSQSIHPFEIKKVPWYETWYFGAVLFLILTIAISRIDRHRGKFSWWYDAIFVVIYLLLTGLIFFLVHYSIHPLVGYNWRLLIFPMIHLCARLTYFFRA